jgi:hypothetical protein
MSLAAERCAQEAADLWLVLCDDDRGGQPSRSSTRGAAPFSKGALLFRKNTVVADVPYLLKRRRDRCRPTDTADSVPCQIARGAST